MEGQNHDFQKDIDHIQQIPIVSTLLDVVCQTTGMRFAAIARVTEDKWITCSVRDDIDFGLKPGSELEIKTTICNEIRQSQKAVIIDCVDTNPDFCDHHTPKMYGFQSYISMPIIRKDGSFFGTLCAIDPKPNHLSSPAVTGMFSLFAELIAFHLNAVEQLEFSELKLSEERLFTGRLEKEVWERTRELEGKNTALEITNAEMRSFTYVASHDLQEPLRKIQTFASRITEKEHRNLSEYGKDLFNRLQEAAKRMQSLIHDLLTYSKMDVIDDKFETVHLGKIIETVKQDLKDELHEKNAVIETNDLCTVLGMPFQFHRLFYNLISNAVKFSSQDRQLFIAIRSEIAKGEKFTHEKITAGITYCHISVADNGVGFEEQHQSRIFELFQRLHDRNEYSGTGAGLAIVKKIIRNHQGIITASSRLNEGARFDIYIPVA